MRIKPVPGRAVRDPHSHALLPEDGRDVRDDDLFWVRRVRDGDVIVEAPAAPKNPAPAAPAAATKDAAHAAPAPAKKEA